MLGNLGLAVSLIFALGGAFLLYDGMTTAEANQFVRVISGAASLSVGLVMAFLITDLRPV